MSASADKVIKLYKDGIDNKRYARCRVFIENGVLYSYGYHFPLAVRGDFGSGISYIINGDKYSITTTGHTNSCISTLYNNVQIPFSALSRAGVISGTWRRGLPSDATFQVQAVGSDTSFYACAVCGRRLCDMSFPPMIPGVGFDHADEYPPCGINNDNGRFSQRAVYKHYLGKVLFHYTDSDANSHHFLSGFDENETGKFYAMNYFMVELPRVCDSIADAIESLKPDAVLEAERANNSPVHRQGEWFFIRLCPRGGKAAFTKKHMPVSSDIDCHHTAYYGHTSLLVLTDDGLKIMRAVSGTIKHTGEPKTHRDLHLDPKYWWQPVKNTALFSVTAVGNVD